MAEPEPQFTISELAERTRTPVSSIKFYLRERLLPPGNLGAKHRAFYGEPHVQRLRLIDILREVGGLTIPAIRDICELLDGKSSHDFSTVIALVIDALGRREPKDAPVAQEAAKARREVLAMLDAKGIQVRRDARAVTDLADALVGVRRAIGPDVQAEAFVPYLDAMCSLAETDFRVNMHLVTDAASAAVGAIFGTVLWEPILVLLRRLAHEHVAVKTFRARKVGGARRRVSR